MDLTRGIETRFTFDPATARYPVWSPDGSKIAFSSQRPGLLGLYVKPSNGALEEQVLLTSPEGKVATSWSRDGRFLLYVATDPGTKNDLWVLPLDRVAEPANPFHCFKLRFRKSIRSFPKICAGSATFRTNPAVMKLTCVRFCFGTIGRARSRRR